jgi:hypothetical protein
MPSNKISFPLAGHFRTFQIENCPLTPISAACVSSCYTYPGRFPIDYPDLHQVVVVAYQDSVSDSAQPQCAFLLLDQVPAPLQDANI